MRQTFLLIFISMSTVNAIAQSELEKEAIKSMCKCFEEIKEFDEEKFVGCFEQTMSDNGELIEKEMVSQGFALTEEDGQKFGKQLFEKVSVDLVYQCKSYATLLDETRNAALNNYNKDSIQLQLAAFAKIPADKRNDDFFTQQGLCNFLLGKNENAIKDFDAALALNDKALQAMMFKAWSLERMLQYEKAVLLYQKVADLSGNAQLRIFAAIADLKMKNR